MFLKKPKKKIIVQVIDYKVIHIDYRIAYSYSSDSEPIQAYDRKETFDQENGTIVVDLYNPNLVSVF